MTERGKHAGGSSRRRVLVTGAGTGRANNLVRSLTAGKSDISVFGCHSDPFVLAKAETDRRFHVPPLSSRADFIAACQPIVAREAIELIIPSSDARRVRSYTSQPSAVVWIQTPRFAISEPDQKSR